jgi:preprotein translocase subunit SecA
LPKQEEETQSLNVSTTQKRNNNSIANNKKVREQKLDYVANYEDHIEGLLDEYSEDAQQKQMPIKSQKTIGRNEKVSVRYPDGKVLQDVKFKSVEEDVKNNKCVIIEDEK